MYEGVKMRYKKQVIDQIEKCYALTMIEKDGQPLLVVAGEKAAPCRLYELDGHCVDQVWDSPGGVMTMVPVPNGNGTFLSTQAFYSPDDSRNARLICARQRNGHWSLKRILDIPHIHRFDVIEKDGIQYVIACTLKSGHKYSGDWSAPGCIWTGILSDDPAAPLTLRLFRDGLTHNHGYTRAIKNDEFRCVISCDEGVFLVKPPSCPGKEWTVERLLDVPASDAILMDLDGDGEEELLTISPFHGDSLGIWHLADGSYQKVYEYPERLPFLHAITAGEIYGRPTVFIGHREGNRLLLGFYYDRAQNCYCSERIDENVGSANCMLFSRNGHPALLVTNREIDEVAIYDIFPDE